MLQEKLATVESLKAQLEMEREGQRKAVEDGRQLAANLKAQLEAKKVDLENLTAAKVQTYRVEMEKRRNEIEQLEAVQATLTAEVDTLKAQLAAKDSEQDPLRKTVEAAVEPLLAKLVELGELQKRADLSRQQTDEALLLQPPAQPPESDQFIANWLEQPEMAEQCGLLSPQGSLVGVRRLSRHSCDDLFDVVWHYSIGAEFIDAGGGGYVASGERVRCGWVWLWCA